MTLPDIPDQAWLAAANIRDEHPRLPDDADTWDVLHAAWPHLYATALRHAAHELLTTSHHEDLCRGGPPGTCDCALGEHYRWLTLHAQLTEQSHTSTEDTRT